MLVAVAADLLNAQTLAFIAQYIKELIGKKDTVIIALNVAWILIYWGEPP